MNLLDSEVDHPSGLVACSHGWMLLPRQRPGFFQSYSLSVSYFVGCCTRLVLRVWHRKHSFAKICILHRIRWIRKVQDQDADVWRPRREKRFFILQYKISIMMRILVDVDIFRQRRPLRTWPYSRVVRRLGHRLGPLFAA